MPQFSQVPAMHVLPGPPHIMPEQQGWPTIPHATHMFPEHTVKTEEQVPGGGGPLQHCWPTMPQG